MRCAAHAAPTAAPSLHDTEQRSTPIRDEWRGCLVAIARFATICRRVAVRASRRLRGWETDVVARDEDVDGTPLHGTERRLVISRHHRLLSPLQSSWSLRVLDGRKELARCSIHSWTGEFDRVVAAPDASLAALRWSDQTEAGLVLVDLVGNPRQLEREWDTRATNWIEGPAWTPDSKLLVLVENPSGAGPWWSEDQSGEAEDDDVSPGGTFTPGSLAVLDRDLRERFRLQINVELAAGWFPAEDAERGLGAPVVVSAEEAVVRVPAHGDRVFALRNR
jgi:hypothetical protein